MGNSEKMGNQDRKDLKDSKRGPKVAKIPASKQDLRLAERKPLVNKLKTIKFETTFINNRPCFILLIR